MASRRQRTLLGEVRPVVEVAHAHRAAHHYEAVGVKAVGDRLVAVHPHGAVRHAVGAQGLGDRARRLRAHVLEKENVAHEASRRRSARVARLGTVSVGSVCGVGGSKRVP